MRVADGVVGQLQLLERVHLTTSPDAAIAVLVAGEIFEDRFRLRAISLSGIHKRDMPTGGEFAIGPGATIQHETVEVRMGDVALELAELHSTRPDGLARIRAFERT